MGKVNYVYIHKVFDIRDFLYICAILYTFGCQCDSEDYKAIHKFQRLFIDLKYNLWEKGLFITLLTSS